MAGRGSFLEKIVERASEHYRAKHVALINKIPTPTRVIGRMNRYGQFKACFDKKSTVDFIGITRGIYIAFDCKETKVKRLPLSYIHEHQLEYLRLVESQGGTSFFVVYFTEANKYYRISITEFDEYFRKNENKKSIPMEYFSENCTTLGWKDSELDYLEGIERRD